MRVIHRFACHHLTTTTRYNATGQPLSSVQKQLISQLSGTLESKSVFVSERGLTSMQWSVYNEATKRVQYSAAPTSTITAEMVMVSGFALLQENAEEITSYQANALNQYTMLSVDDITDFIPEYDADGNQTRVKTSTGIWAITYDAENRPTDFTKVDTSGSTTIHCEYDYMGRRATKQVSVNGNITLHQRYLYRGYLQIACVDLTRASHPALWLITWDPTQPIATRPLAIQKDGTWYTYAPYGEVTSEGDVTQPIQWSSEHNDTELGLVYYNYRHYNPTDGRWIGRDMLGEKAIFNLVKYVNNSPIVDIDKLGNDRVYSTLQEFPYIHARVSIDNWIVVNGKYKKSGVYIYEFGIVIQADTILSAIVKTFVTIPTSLVWAEGTVSKTNASRHMDGYHAHSNPCQDLATIKIGDAEVSVKHYYNIFFHNCHVWATNFLELLCLENI